MSYVAPREVATEMIDMGKSKIFMSAIDFNMSVTCVENPKVCRVKAEMSGKYLDNNSW